MATKKKRVRPTTAGLFDTTAPAPAEEAEGKERANIQSRGVGLKATEWEEIDRLAAELGYNSHKLTTTLLRYGLDALRSGRIKTEEKTIKTLKI